MTKFLYALCLCFAIGTVGFATAAAFTAPLGGPVFWIDLVLVALGSAGATNAVVNFRNELR